VFLEILTNDAIPIVGTSNSSCHVGYCISVTPQRDSILDCSSEWVVCLKIKMCIILMT
jgi:hypothetical protein